MDEDSLKRLWDVQEAQQRELGLDPEALSPLDRRQVVGDLMLMLHEELAELQRHAAPGYKRHILNDGEPDAGNVASEAADVFKSLMAMCITLGLSSADLFQAVIDKTTVVRAKAVSARTRIRESTVLAVDLDGVLADDSAWHAEAKALVAGLAPGSDKHQREEAWKEDWYKRGRFRELPPMPGAADVLRTVRGWGWRVVIATARPQWQYKRIYSDTLEWLQTHGMEHDLILFGKDKVELIHHHLAPAWPVAFVEDYERNARALSHAGIHVLLFDRPHNRQLNLPRVDRVYVWPEIMAILEKKKCDMTD